MSLRSVVIVGAGQAGYQTAASLRQEGFGGAITLISDEPGLPYQRPPLSKNYLLGKIGRETLRFRPEKYYSDHCIEVVHGRAAAIDRTNRRVALATGAAVDYDHLVLAVGARNRPLPVPGSDLNGVFGMRTQGDADALHACLGKAKNVVVVGAGFIGLEFAAVARALGSSVQVLELADRPMARAVSEPTSRYFAQAHASWGNVLHFHQGVSQILGRNGQVEAVQTTNGRTLPADVVVVGVGVLPNTELAAEAGLDIENGIRVDAHLVTSDTAISAIGDCASFPSAHTGHIIRLESVQNATDQARLVAARLVGKTMPYQALPWFWTEQGNLKLQMVGLIGAYDESVTVGSPDSGAFSILCFRENQLVGVESINRPLDHMASRKLLARGVEVSPSVASTPDFDLRTWEASGRLG
jgi:NADPH-dependent 2,4-dienoyl-CoA reductase/sulfur reductase-like enzyme